MLDWANLNQPSVSAFALHLPRNFPNFLLSYLNIQTVSEIAGNIFFRGDHGLVKLERED